MYGMKRGFNFLEDNSEDSDVEEFKEDILYCSTATSYTTYDSTNQIREEKNNQNSLETTRSSFLLRDIPENVFSIGSDIFVSCYKFCERVLIDIRKYGKNCETCYPSRDGVTISLRQFITLIENSQLKKKQLENEHDNGDFLEPLTNSFPKRRDDFTIYSCNLAGIFDEEMEEELIIDFENSSSVTLKKGWKSVRKYTSSVTLSIQQWENIFTLKRKLISCILNVKFENFSIYPFIDYLEFRLGCKLHETVPTPQGVDEDIIFALLRYTFKASIIEAICEYGELHNPLIEPQSLLRRNSSKRLYESLIKMNPFSVFRCLFDSMINEPVHPLLKCKLINFLSKNFFFSINFIKCVENAVIEFEQYW